MINKTDKNTCNYCQNQMPYTIELETKVVPVCLIPKCPAFGLLQLSEQTIDKFLKKEGIKK